MKKIAIDIVLLPPKKISDQCIKISREYAHRGRHPFPLNAKDNLPHLSLFMGVIAANKLPEAQRVLRRIAGQFKPLPVSLTRLGYKGFPDKRRYFLWADVTRQLRKLHEMANAAMLPLTKNSALPGIFYKKKGEFFHSVTPLWLSNHFKKHSFDKFRPHITLRTSFAKVKKLPIRFTAGTLAMCHLGDLCTCRKILYKTRLKKSVL